MTFNIQPDDADDFARGSDRGCIPAAAIGVRGYSLLIKCDYRQDKKHMDQDCHSSLLSLQLCKANRKEVKRRSKEVYADFCLP